jgi:hypothetical protein
MFKKLKKLIVTVASVLALSAPALAPAVAHAQVDTSNTVNQGLCSGLEAATGKNDTCSDPGANQATSSLGKIIKQIIDILSFVIGAVAVIMIIVGGFKYITSGGDSGKVSGAKNAIIYALIGLIIVALAQVIVRFVLNNARV